jgi:hypothetical protein
MFFFVKIILSSELIESHFCEHHTCSLGLHMLGRDQDDRAKCNDGCSLDADLSENVHTPVHMCVLHPLDSILDHRLFHRNNGTHVEFWMLHFDMLGIANPILGSEIENKRQIRNRYATANTYLKF